MMEDECVEKRKWLSKDEFTEMLGITNMLPGPNATEMAIHIGIAMGGRVGGFLSGFGFTIPSFIIITALSWLYFHFGSMPSVGWLFYGINPVVVAIILVTVFRLGKSSITDWKLLGLFMATVVAARFGTMNEAIIIIGAGFIGMLLYGSTRKRTLSTFFFFVPLSFPFVTFTFAELPVLLQLFLEFLKASLLMFGSGLVIIPLIGPDVVEVFGWMSYKEFFDGVTLGQITPGPVMKTAAFVGYKVAGLWGAVAAFSGVFLPPFIIVTALAPYFRKIRSNQWLQGFLKGVKVGAVGAIVAVTISLAQIAFPDLLTILIAAVSLLVLLKLKVNMSLLVIAAGAIGVLTKMLL
jgi:chromate transporter